MMSDEIEITEAPQDKQKFLLYRTLSLLWVFPSLGAIVILNSNVPSRSWLEALRSPQLEDLVAIMVIACHLAMILKAYRYHRLNRGLESDSLPTD